MSADAPDISAAVSPDVLAQALGSALAQGERLLVAAFADSVEGRGMAILVSRSGHSPPGAPFLSPLDHPALVFVTDRRIAKVVAWRGRGEDDLDSTMYRWQSGTLLDRRHRLTRRYLWLGEMREAAICPERSRRAEALFLTRFDGCRVRVRAPLPVLRRLDAAVRVALTGPGRWARPQ